MVTTDGTTRQNDDALWDVEDVARYLKVAEKTVRAWILHRDIPFVRVGSLIRFRRSEIDAWIEAGRPHVDGDSAEEGVA